MLSRNRAFIVGSGYSLKQGVDRGLLDLLKNEVTFGVNDTIRFFQPTVAMFGDWWAYHNRYSWYCLHRLVVGRFSYPMINKEFDIQKQDDLILLKSSHTYNKGNGLQGGLYSPVLTGSMALSLAIELGYQDIYLLGFDNCAIDGKTHWYEGIDDAGQFEDLDGNKLSGMGFNHDGKYKTGIYNNEQKSIDEIWEPFIDEANIINVSPKSRITTFKKMQMSVLIDMLTMHGEKINQRKEQKQLRLIIEPYNQL